MTQMKLSYLVAKTQLGQKEISGSKDNPKIVEYHDATTLKATDDETPWCASFVNWCLIIAAILMNPGLAEKLLKNARYSDREIAAFFESAVKVAQQLGFPVGPILARANTGTNVRLGTRSALARSFAIFADKATDPKEGDIVVFARGSDGVSGHVAYLVKRGVTFCNVLGGNQSNQVCYSDYARARVLSYRTEG